MTPPAPIRVLLVEDNPGDARLVRESLESARLVRFDLEWVDRLEAALRRLREATFDVLLLDLLLPDSYGFDTLDTVHRHAPTVPVVVFTSVDDDAFALEAVRRGAQDYLPKAHLGDPAGAVAIRRTLRFAVDRQRHIRELEAQHEKLRQIKAQLHDLIELIADGVVIVGLDGNIRFANSAAERLFGHTMEELVGETFGHHLPFEGPAEVEFERPDGSRSLVELRAAETEWEGEPCQIVTLRELQVTRPPRRGRVREPSGGAAVAP